LSFERCDGIETVACLFECEGDARKVPVHMGEAWGGTMNCGRCGRERNSL